MALHLITGRANVGKTGVLHDAVLRGLDEQRAATLLLPTFAEVQRARAEFAERRIIGVHVDTLDRWAHLQWSLHGDGRRPVDQVARMVLAGSAAARADGRLAESGRTEGLGLLVAELASRTAGVQLPQTLGGIDELLFGLVEEYTARLNKSGLVEPGEMLLRLAESRRVRGGVIAVNRFTDVSPAQERFLVGLAEDNDVYVALSWESGHAATAALNELVGRLTTLAAEHTAVAAADGKSELDGVEKGLFDPPPEPLVSRGQVTLAEAAGVEAEAALIASQVRKALNDGIIPDQVAIAFRSLSGRRHHVAAALGAQGVDCSVDIAMPLGRTPLGSAVRGLLLTAAGSGGRTELMAYLHSPFSGADMSRVESFDALCRRHRIVEPATLLREASQVSSQAESAVTAAYRVLDGPVNGNTAAWHSLVDHLTLTGAHSSLRADDTALDAGVADRLHEAIDAASALAEPVSPGAFIEAVCQIVVSSRATERPGAVYLTEVHRMRARRFSVVVLGGLTAAEFSSEAREPLAVSVLTRVGLPAGTEERLSERMLFYTVATRARERLILVRQSSDSAGRELRPSVFWDEVVDLYRTPEQTVAGEEGLLRAQEKLPLSRLAEAAPSFRPGRRTLRQKVGDDKVPAPRAARGYLSAERILRAEDEEFSITELEAYHACPYRWFYDRVVRPSSLDESYDAANRGSYAHRLMARFYRRFRAEIASRLTPDNLDAGLDLFDRVKEQVDDEATVKPLGLLEEMSHASAIRWARTAIIQDATALEGFEPVAEEWRFGRKEERPFAFAGVALKGSIDRIDEGTDALVVTDYKSASTVHGQRTFQAHGLMQVVIYAAAAEEVLHRPVAGAFYRSLPSGAFRGYWNSEFGGGCAKSVDTVDAAGVQALRAWASEAAAAAAAGIEARDIECRPRKGACDYCGARGLCEVTA